MKGAEKTPLKSKSEQSVLLSKEDFPVMECIYSPKNGSKREVLIRERSKPAPVIEFEEQVSDVADLYKSQIYDDEEEEEDEPFPAHHEEEETYNDILQAAKAGSLSTRIATIKDYCISGLGVQSFDALYKFLKQEANLDSDDPKTQEKMLKAVGSSNVEHLQFAPLIAQLIFCEETLCQ